MRRVVGRVSVLTMIAAGASSALSSCYADTTSAPSQRASSAANKGKGAVGSLGVNLHIGDGIAVNTASYTISGPASYTKAGSIDLSSTEKLSTIIGGIPAGNGYAIAIAATAVDGVTACSGSHGFNVMAQVTTTTTVALECHEPQRKGSVLLTGVTNICPVIETIGAWPDYVLVGDTVSITAKAHDSDHGPSALAYQWSSSAGMLDPNGAAASFTCTDSGVVTITLTVSDGDPSPSCTDTTTTTVGCVMPQIDP